jgi:Alcohol dehydrogenase transcription factor Myb/SANT-like.
MTTTDRTLGMIDARHLSKKFLTEFIELYKSLPCLWKIKSKDYVDRNKKNAAYDLMVEKLREVSSSNLFIYLLLLLHVFHVWDSPSSKFSAISLVPISKSYSH